MTTRIGVRGVNRVVALALALIWLGAGVIGIFGGVIYGQPLLVALSFLAIGYAALWFRVVVRSRLLTWRELVAPWRGG
jgi:hypothetical protein